jgi:membrane protease YdiL (CAAX protease family)
MGAVIIGAYLAFGRGIIDVERFRQAVTRLGFAQPGRYLAYSAALIGGGSLAEEYVWRWFVFRRAEIIWAAAATLMAAIFFTIHHIIALAAHFGPTVTFIASVGVFAGGWIWSWCYERYRSIWPGYISHAIVDLVILALGWKLLWG